MNDCFAFKKGLGCVVTTGGKCAGECAFYKTTAQLDSELEVVNKRLASLPVEQQVYIADKYHVDEQPWRTGKKVRQ